MHEIRRRPHRAIIEKSGRIGIESEGLAGRQRSVVGVQQGRAIGRAAFQRVSPHSGQRNRALRFVIESIVTIGRNFTRLNESHRGAATAEESFAISIQGVEIALLSDIEGIAFV